MSLVPCGRTMGHGTSCGEGYLCEQCREIIRVTDQRSKLTDALLNAIKLQDEMLNEIRRLSMATGQGEMLPIQLMAAKRNFDVAMKVLLTSPQ